MHVDKAAEVGVELTYLHHSNALLAMHRTRFTSRDAVIDNVKVSAAEWGYDHQVEDINEVYIGKHIIVNDVVFGFDACFGYKNGRCSLGGVVYLGDSFEFSDARLEFYLHDRWTVWIGSQQIQGRFVASDVDVLIGTRLCRKLKCTHDDNHLAHNVFHCFLHSLMKRKRRV